MFSEHYKLLSVIFSYPDDEKLLKESSEKLYRISLDIHRLDDFMEFIRGSSLSAIQEEYVSTFELQPLCAPYISHHIYGESYKKGEYMVFLKEIYRNHSFEYTINELPDHIAVISEFLSVLDRNRSEFISRIMPGLIKMSEKVENKNTSYKEPVQLLYKLCSSELSEFEKEVVECSTF